MQHFGFKRELYPKYYAGLFHIVVENRYLGQGCEIASRKTGEALLLVGRRLLTPSHFLRSGNLLNRPFAAQSFLPVCQDSAEFKYSVPTTLHAALLAWQQAEMQRPAAICFKVEPFLPSGLSPLLEAATACKNIARGTKSTIFQNGLKTHPKVVNA